MHKRRSAGTAPVPHITATIAAATLAAPAAVAVSAVTAAAAAAAAAAVVTAKSAGSLRRKVFPGLSPARAPNATHFFSLGLPVQVEGVPLEEPAASQPGLGASSLAQHVSAPTADPARTPPLPLATVPAVAPPPPASVIPRLSPAEAAERGRSELGCDASGHTDECGRGVAQPQLGSPALQLRCPSSQGPLPKSTPPPPLALDTSPEPPPLSPPRSRPVARVVSPSPAATSSPVTTALDEPSSSLLAGTTQSTIVAAARNQQAVPRLPGPLLPAAQLSPSPLTARVNGLPLHDDTGGDASSRVDGSAYDLCISASGHTEHPLLEPKVGADLPRGSRGEPPAFPASSPARADPSPSASAPRAGACQQPATMSGMRTASLVRLLHQLRRHQASTLASPPPSTLPHLPPASPTHPTLATPTGFAAAPAAQPFSAVAASATPHAQRVPVALFVRPPSAGPPLAAANEAAPPTAASSRVSSFQGPPRARTISYPKRGRSRVPFCMRCQRTSLASFYGNPVASELVGGLGDGPRGVLRGLLSTDHIIASVLMRGPSGAAPREASGSAVLPNRRAHSARRPAVVPTTPTTLSRLFARPLRPFGFSPSSAPERHPGTTVGSDAGMPLQATEGPLRGHWGAVEGPSSLAGLPARRSTVTVHAAASRGRSAEPRVVARPPPAMMLGPRSTPASGLSAGGGDGSYARQPRRGTSAPRSRAPPISPASGAWLGRASMPLATAVASRTNVLSGEAARQSNAASLSAYEKTVCATRRARSWTCRNTCHMTLLNSPTLLFVFCCVHACMRPLVLCFVAGRLPLLLPLLPSPPPPAPFPPPLLCPPLSRVAASRTGGCAASGGEGSQRIADFSHGRVARVVSGTSGGITGCGRDPVSAPARPGDGGRPNQCLLKARRVLAHSTCLCCLLFRCCFVRQLRVAWQ